MFSGLGRAGLESLLYLSDGLQIFIRVQIAADAADGLSLGVEKENCGIALYLVFSSQFFSCLLCVQLDRDEPDQSLLRLSTSGP